MKTLCNIRTVNKVYREHNFTIEYLKSKNKNWLNAAERKMIINNCGKITNEMKSKVEHYDFIKNPPNVYFAYVNIPIIYFFSFNRRYERNNDRIRDFITARFSQNTTSMPYFSLSVSNIDIIT